MSFLKNKTIDELAGIVSLFPWFEAARKELCLRTGDFSQSSIFLSSRKELFDSVYNKETVDLSDKDIASLVKAASKPQTKVRSASGDFFSQEDYDDVRKNDDNIFSSFAEKIHSDREDSDGNDFLDICTETLAQIYADQGYLEQAKYIYSKLSLRYPEKNVYFAGLIRKLDEIKN